MHQDPEKRMTALQRKAMAGDQTAVNWLVSFQRRITAATAKLVLDKDLAAFLREQEDAIASGPSTEDVPVYLRRGGE